MKTTAPGNPGAQTIDAGWILDLTNRWKLADDYVSGIGGPGEIKAETELKRLVHHDVPILVRELIHSRPELA